MTSESNEELAAKLDVWRDKSPTIAEAARRLRADGELADRLAKAEARVQELEDRCHKRGEVIEYERGMLNERERRIRDLESQLSANSKGGDAFTVGDRVQWMRITGKLSDRFHDDDAWNIEGDDGRGYGPIRSRELTRLPPEPAKLDPVRESIRNGTFGVKSVSPWENPYGQDIPCKHPPEPAKGEFWGSVQSISAEQRKQDPLVREMACVPSPAFTAPEPAKAVDFDPFAPIDQLPAEIQRDISTERGLAPATADSKPATSGEVKLYGIWDTQVTLDQLIRDYEPGVPGHQAFLHLQRVLAGVEQVAARLSQSGFSDERKLGAELREVLR